MAPGRGTAAPAAPGTSSGRSRTAAWTGTARWAECRKYLQVQENILSVREPCDGCEVPHSEQDPGGGHRLHQIQGAEQQPGQGPGAAEVQTHDLIIKHNNMLCYLNTIIRQVARSGHHPLCGTAGAQQDPECHHHQQDCWPGQGSAVQYSAVFITLL